MLSGDILLGGLFPIHKQGVDDNICGQILDEDGIQPLEAMLFTLDEINRYTTSLYWQFPSKQIWPFSYLFQYL